MARPSYRAGLEWLVLNDDTEWLIEGEPDCGLSVAAALLADLFGKPDVVVKRDLRRTHARLEAERGR